MKARNVKRSEYFTDKWRYAFCPEKMYALAKLTQSCHNPFNSASSYFVVSASFYVTKDWDKRIFQEGGGGEWWCPRCRNVSQLFPNDSALFAKQMFICLLVDPHNDPLRLHFELLLPLYKWLAVYCLDEIHFTVSVATSSCRDSYMEK